MQIKKPANFEASLPADFKQALKLLRSE